MRKFVLLDKDDAVINTVSYDSEKFFKKSNDIFDILGGIPNNITKLIDSLGYYVDFLIPFEGGEDFVISKPQAFTNFLTEYGIYDDEDVLDGRLFNEVFPLFRDLAFPAIFKEVLQTGNSYSCRLLEYKGKKIKQSYDTIIVKYNNNMLLFLTKTETNFDLMFEGDEEDELFNKSPDSIAIIQNNKFVKRNEKFIKLINSNSEKLNNPDKLNINYFLDSNNYIFEGYSSEEVFKIFKEVLEREKYSHILTLRKRTKSGLSKWYTLQIIPVIYQNKPAVQIKCEDITERKNTTLKALRLENDLKIIQKDGNLAMMHWDPVHKFEWTSGIYNIIGEAPGSIPPGQDILLEYLTKEPEENKRIKDLVKESIKNHSDFNTITDLETKDGIKHVAISVHCYAPSGEDNLPQSVGYIQDISTAVKTEEEKKNLEITLEDKNIILKEMYQRFKGNLQVLLSYLNLDIRFHPNNPEITVESTKARINALVILHESMGQSADLIDVNLANYIKNLIGSMLSFYQANNIRTDFDLDDSINLSVEKSIPVGLLISEIIINTIKYGFDNNNLKGTVSILLKKENDKFVLAISDDGLGVNDEVIGKIKLSITIIDSLVDQLDGISELIEKEKGIGIKIIF